MAVTVNSRTDSVFGDKHAVLANITFTTTADAYDFGLHVIQFSTASGFSAALTSITHPTSGRTANNTIPVVFNGTGGTFDVLLLGY